MQQRSQPPPYGLPHGRWSLVAARKCEYTRDGRKKSVKKKSLSTTTNKRAPFRAGAAAPPMNERITPPPRRSSLPSTRASTNCSANYVVAWTLLLLASSSCFPHYYYRPVTAVSDLPLKIKPQINAAVTATRCKIRPFHTASTVRCS